mgnify:CR=1 FL=1
MFASNILKNTISSLKEAMTCSWSYGDVNQWREYSLTLKSIVKVSVENLQSLDEYINQLEEENKNLRNQIDISKSVVKTTIDVNTIKKSLEHE